MNKTSLFLTAIVFCLGSINLFADVWLADSRSGALALSQLASAPDGSNVWAGSNRQSFVATHNPNIPCVIMIHGNWMSAPEARAYGLLFNKMIQNAGNYRLVIWSWPSDRLDVGVRRDAQIKDQRSMLHAPFLTSLLRSLPSGSKVSIVGFSFGAKLACSSLQMLANSGHDLRIRAVLLAAAVDDDALAPGRQFGRVINTTEGILVHINPSDKTLKYYSLINTLCGSDAIGRDGIAGISSQKIRTFDVSRIIRKKHGIVESLTGLLADRSGFQTYVMFDGR